MLLSVTVSLLEKPTILFSKINKALEFKQSSGNFNPLTCLSVTQNGVIIFWNVKCVCGCTIYYNIAKKKKKKKPEVTLLSKIDIIQVEKNE